jgi:hypothetical protein
MQYILLIYVREDLPFDPAVMKDYFDISRELRAAGKLQAAEPLMPTSTATSVRIRDGEALITDGPFAETREALGGFYLIDAKDLDEALAIAKRLPAVKIGTIEVRPVRPAPS